MSIVCSQYGWAGWLGWLAGWMAGLAGWGELAGCADCLSWLSGWHTIGLLEAGTHAACVSVGLPGENVVFACVCGEGF